MMFNKPMRVLLASRTFELLSQTTAGRHRSGTAAFSRPVVRYRHKGPPTDKRAPWRKPRVLEDHFQHAKESQVDNSPSGGSQSPQPAGTRLEKIRPQDLQSRDTDETHSAKIEDCRYVASYSWVDELEKPTIVVPGVPPMWKPPRRPTQLKQDAGEYFRDPNAAWCPEYPLEPAVRAILAQNVGVEPQSVDLFTCTSTLRNLLSFLQQEQPSFNFCTDVIGETVFFVRRPRSSTETVIDTQGFALTLARKYLEREHGSKSHQRVISYKFQGLRCCVRFECYGYLKGQGTPPKLTPEGLEMMPPSEYLHVNQGGKVIAQEAIFDLRTRAAYKKGKDALPGVIERLWVTQTPNFVMAYHKYGIFNDIEIQDRREDIATWEKNNQELLAQLGRLLRKIMDAAKNTIGGRCEVSSSAHGELEIRTPMGDGSRALPDFLRTAWAGTPRAIGD